MKQDWIFRLGAQEMFNKQIILNSSPSDSFLIVSSSRVFSSKINNEMKREQKLIANPAKENHKY
jgi:hypothetical protein